MSFVTPKGIIGWSALALLIAVGITFLAQKLHQLVQRTLPTWTFKDVQAKFEKTYPGKDLYQIVSYLIRRDRTFSRMIKILPWQCLFALFMLATLWAFAIPPTSYFWLLIVKNLFIFEFMLLALYPAFCLLHKIQRMTIERVQALLKQK